MSRTPKIWLFLIAIAVAPYSLTIANDAAPGLAAGVGCDNPLSPGDHEGPVPGWPNRDGLVHIPSNYDCHVPTPVVLVLHGGGSRKEDMRLLTCPDGDLENPSCMDRLADREGFIVVYPDGTQNYLWRTFNATSTDTATQGGAAAADYACVSGYACSNDVDDIAYFNALLDELERTVNVDRSRVFATGISNGAAMAHRLACEMSDRIAAIAPVAGGNQFSVFHECRPGRAVPVIEFHGTQDPSWGYGNITTDLDLNGQGTVISLPRTIAGWVQRNGCYAAAKTEALPDRNTTDDSTVTRIRYVGCENGADVELYKINGGGHMWPDGFQWDVFFGQHGATNRDINGNTVMWDFFRAHPLP